MRKFLALVLAAGLLYPLSAHAQRATRPLCDVGSSVVDLMYLQSTGDLGRIDLAVLRASIGFLEECPTRVILAFKQEGARGDPSRPDAESALRRTWIAGVRSAVEDSGDEDLRALLVLAHARLSRLGDSALTAYVTGLFEGAQIWGGQGRPPNDSLFARLALETLHEYGVCSGDGCNDASDMVLFLLGTHPNAVFKAMHADASSGADWLRSVGDDSFAGDSENAATREAAKRAVLAKLAVAPAFGLEGEKQACVRTLNRIRYRVIG